ncbi:MAG: polysulfide reductase NrfD [Magnetococcales bacterium]|nr:polysulfide reductase NrfD [Magnetococcales bacterium]
MSDPIRIVAGSRLHLLWQLLLIALIAMGLHGYALQHERGLGVTGMSDQVSWGLYIANFTFLVGLAASAVLLVIPALLLDRPSLGRLIPLGEAMAIAAVTMSLLFVTVDLGQPLRAWHVLPVLGTPNFPTSILAWDVFILTAYLLLNLGLFYQFARQPVHPARPWVLLTAILLGIAIHTVTAFMLAGLPARPVWHSAVLAPRFIASAFASGAGMLLVVLFLLEKTMHRPRPREAMRLLNGILAVALWVDLFLLGSDFFTRFYPLTSHSGVILTPLSRSAVVIEGLAALVATVPAWRRRPVWLFAACLATIGAVMIEKGLGLVVPGFQPTPLGEYADYAPTRVEIHVALGIWGFGLLLFTWLVRMALSAWDRFPQPFGMTKEAQ